MGEHCIRSILLGLACVLLSPAFATEIAGDRLSLEARVDYALAFDGETRIRQFGTEGSRLDLRDDLGVDDWLSAGLDVAWRFDDWHSLRGGFTFHAFRGTNRIDRDIVHEGAAYPEGTKLTFSRTNWWHAEMWCGLTPVSLENARFTILAGVIVDFLDLWLVPEPRLPRQPRDDHENFGTSWVPLPAVGARLDLYPAPGLHLGLEARGAHVEDLPTWHTSGGDKNHWQTSFDAELQLGYGVHVVEFGATLRYRLFHIEQQNREDGNEFRIQGVQAGVYLRLIL